MKFLNKLKISNRVSKRDKKATYEMIVKLLGTDAKTAEKLNDCIENPRTYYAGNTKDYYERGMDSDADEDSIIWLGMVDILIAQGKMYEFDYNVELEDFVYGIREITNHDALVFDENCLDEDSDITSWLEILCNAWLESGFVIAGMDIDSDSYCVFITDKDIFDRLAVEAEKTGYRIALAQEL